MFFSLAIISVDCGDKIEVTVPSGSPTLDFPLSSFPDTSTFTRDSVAVDDNTIYYVRSPGAGQSYNYARIHVHLRPATFLPNRSVEIRVPLQRTPNVPYAYREKGNGELTAAGDCGIDLLGMSRPF